MRNQCQPWEEMVAVNKITKFFNADPGADLVLLQLANFEATSLTEAAPLKIADAHVPQGQRVFTMSSPRGLAKTVSRGLLATTWSIESQQLLVITAPIWRGSSGGPVFNSAGEVVGVIRGGVPGRKMSFAISIDTAVRLLNAPVTTVVERPRHQNRVAARRPDELYARGYAAYRAIFHCCKIFRTGTGESTYGVGCTLQFGALPPGARELSSR